MTSSRLTPDDWLTAGFAALQSDGPALLAAEPLARRMGTTKGSFYWHFADVPAFHTAMVHAWQDRATAALSDALRNEGSADQRLRGLGRSILTDDLETAMRIWAMTNASVREATARVDADRLTYINLLLREMGLANPDFARALQAALVGLPQITSEASTRKATFDTLVDTVLAL